jgi:hypothetical protein
MAVFHTIEAIINEHGEIKLKEQVTLSKSTRALVTILGDDVTNEELLENTTAFLSQQALARDWLRPEEDEAWSHLQQAQ